MTRSEVIDRILALVPAGADEVARSRPLLHELSDIDLEETYKDLSSLVREGTSLLGRMSPGAISQGSARRLEEARLARARLDSVNARVQRRTERALSPTFHEHSPFNEDDRVLREAVSMRDAALAEARRLDNFIRLYHGLRGDKQLGASPRVLSEFEYTTLRGSA